MNIPKYIDGFSKEMIRRNYRQNTVDNYVSNLKVFLSKHNHLEHPLHINEGHIRAYLGAYKEPNTQRSHHGAIKLFYDICMNQKGKFKYIPYARKKNSLPIVLSKEEVQKMFDVCENLKHKVILSILYACGLRVSELINLKWREIDRSRMVINIIDAKGGKDRQVMLPENIIPLLERYYRLYKSKTYVLNGQNTPKYSARSVGEVIKQLASKAEINKRVYTHLMRHNAFTHMVESGVDINLIQRLAGHSSVKTTNIYLHTSHNVISKIQSPISFINI